MIRSKQPGRENQVVRLSGLPNKAKEGNKPNISRPNETTRRKESTIPAQPRAKMKGETQHVLRMLGTIFSRIQKKKKAALLSQGR